ncbi:hypothetical protein GGR50DRAFT_390380 [Xylaria sp. CBS 124048]|nr:hypothetical protein GGR50DRAFT_390380 [Xylaria sp. CBS 124048]
MAFKKVTSSAGSWYIRGVILALLLSQSGSFFPRRSQTKQARLLSLYISQRTIDTWWPWNTRRHEDLNRSETCITLRLNRLKISWRLRLAASSLVTRGHAKTSELTSDNSTIARKASGMPFAAGCTYRARVHELPLHNISAALVDQRIITSGLGLKILTVFYGTKLPTPMASSRGQAVR